MACVMNQFCPKVNEMFCPNLKKGYCSWSKCPHNHNVYDSCMGDSVLNLQKYGAVWVNLGKIPYITKEMIFTMTMTIGEYSRFDLVEMPGNPSKGGSYWCAVVFFKSISAYAKNKLLTGNCIWLSDNNRQIRVTLFRSEVKSFEVIKAKQDAKKAAVQANKAVESILDSIAWLVIDSNNGVNVWNCDMDWK